MYLARFPPLFYVIYIFLKVGIIMKTEKSSNVQVVRCKDCKYYVDSAIGMVFCPNHIGGWVANDWFCADGVRKE